MRDCGRNRDFGPQPVLKRGTPRDGIEQRVGCVAAAAVASAFRRTFAGRLKPAATASCKTPLIKIVCFEIDTCSRQARDLFRAD